jgi:hypothetical protein
MTPEEAFEKWWKSSAWDGATPTSDNRECFLAGLQYQEMNQINCLYEIRKAVGDPEGRLMQSDLVERVKELANPWRPIETAPKDGTRITATSQGCAIHTHYWRKPDGPWMIEYADGPAWQPTHWMPQPSPLKSVTTEKEEG